MPKLFLKNIKLSILIALPFIVLTIAIFRYKIIVPYDDDWNFIPTIEKFYEKNLSFADLWEPVNEHRPFLSKMMLLNIIKLTSWDNTFEIIFSLIFALSILFLIFQLVDSVFKKTKIEILWPYAAVSIMVFSLNQFENWLLGGQLAVYLCLLAFLAGLKILNRRKMKDFYYLLAILSGLISTFSFGYGVLFWPLGLLVLLINKVNKRYLFIWTTLSLLILFFYFNGLKIGLSTLTKQSLWEYLFSFTLYLLVFFGRPLGVVLYHRLFTSLILGTLGIAFNLFSFWIVFKQKIMRLREIIYPLLLSLLTIGSAFLAAFSRASSGFEQAHSSRYITFGNLLWISNIILFTLLSRKTSLFSLKKTKIILIIFFSLIIGSSLRSLKEFRIFSQMFKAGREAVLNNVPEPLLPKLVHPEHKKYLESREFLKKFKLSIFRE